MICIRLRGLEICDLSGGNEMTTIQLMNMIIRCESKKDIIKLLNKHRVPIIKSKYC